MDGGLLLILALTAVLCAAAYVYERVRRGGPRRGPWTDQPGRARRAATQAEIDAAFAEITKREKGGRS
ncbi:MAG: hypothetical protein HOW97_02440 [Catenulispora sp.]|nr:hypothetical protein [Catenulispora sp.]